MFLFSSSLRRGRPFAKGGVGNDDAPCSVEGEERSWGMIGGGGFLGIALMFVQQDKSVCETVYVADLCLRPRFGFVKIWNEINGDFFLRVESGE